MGNQQASGNSTTTTIEKKQNKRHSNPAALRVFKSTTSKASNSTPNVAHSKKSHPLIKPLALEQLKNNNPNNRMTMGGSLMENSSSLPCSENNRLTCDEGSYGNSLSNNRQLLVDFHASAKTPRHVRTIIDDEEDDNIEESFVIMRSNIYRNNSNQMEEGENPLSIETSVSTTGTTLPSPSIPITPSSTQKPSYLLPTSPVSPTNQPHKAASMPVINSSTASPKKKHALKILAKLKSKFNHHHHQEVETSESPALQQSLSDGALSSSRSAASQNVQHNSSSSSLLKIDSHRSMQSYVTNISSNNTSSTTLVTNGQPAQKVLRMNEDGEYVDEETYSDDSESFNVSESEHDEDDDCIDQFIQGTFVQTMDDSISYLKHSMRNQLV